MNDNNQQSEVLILLVSGSCCYPGLAALDGQAQQIIRQALDETGISGEVRTLPISSALSGGIPRKVLQQLQAGAQRANLMRLPAIFVDGKLICWGVPDLVTLKSALQTNQTPAGE